MQTITVRKEQVRDVTLTLERDAKGNGVLLANGEAIAKVTTEGYFRRLPCSAAVFLRRLPDGRVAIKKKRRS